MNLNVLNFNSRRTSFKTSRIREYTGNDKKNHEMAIGDRSRYKNFQRVRNFNWPYVVSSKALLKRMDRKPYKFLRKLVNLDETWIYHNLPEMTDQSKQKLVKSKRDPKKTEAVKWAGKVMATLFWDPRSTIFVDYISKSDRRLILDNSLHHY